MVILDIGKDVGATTSVTYTIKTGCDVKFNGDGCDWLKIEEAKDSVKFTVTKANEGNERKCYITPVVGDWACDNNKFIVRQQAGEPEPFSCYRGTDNGTDYPTGGGKGDSHPILLCGDVDSSSIDSIYVEGGLEYSIDNKASWHQLTRGEGFKPASWVRVYLKDNIGCCGNPYIGMEAVEEFNASGTELERSVTFWFKAHIYPEDGLVPACAAVICSGPAGKELCKEWEYEIKQCAKGYYWCGEHSYNAVPVKCGGECSKVKSSCDCSEPPTPTCDCNITITKTTLPKEGYSDFTEIGTYTTTCSGTWGTPTRKSGDPSFVDAFDISNNKIRVKVLQNPGNSRSTTYEATIGNCSTTFTINQDGTEPGCDVSVTVEGLEGTDKLTIQWGESSTPGEIGNETKTHTLTSDTDVINVRVYDSRNPKRYNVIPQQAEDGLPMSCSERSRTVRATKITPTCTCDNMKFSADTYSITLEADEGASENINVDYYICEPIISCSDTWFTANMQNKVIYVIANSKNPTTSKRYGKILVKDANNSTCKEIDVSQEAGTGCDKQYQRSMKVRVKANSDLAIAGAINLNNLGNDTLTFTYGDESQESIDLAGYQVNAINPGGESVWRPTDSLDNVICTDKPGLEHYEFDGFPEGFTVTINNLNHEAIQRDGMPNGHYATVDTSYYFYLDYEVILDGSDVKFTIVIKQD